MTRHEIFAQFFTNLLELENRQQAREIARKTWPATHDMWLHPMKIDGVLIELGLARVMDDGRVGYLVIDDSRGWRNDSWEIEEATPEQEQRMREMMLAADERTVVLEDGSTVSWRALKGMAARAHVWFKVQEDDGRLHFRMGPDHFPDSYVLAWISPQERAGTTAYQDNRCRSADPDDFLSRIEALTT